MVTKIFHDFQSTLGVKIFSIWNMYTRMHGEFGEFFLEFFDLKISIYRFFSGNRFQRQFLDSRHLPYVCIVLQFLDRSSNLKAGCKKDAIYDAFDTIYVSYKSYQ